MTKRNTFLRALALGFPGIVVLTLVATPPEGIPRIALAVNPIFMMIILASLGTWLVTKTGLRSSILLGDTLDRTPLARLAVLAIAIGGLIALADHFSATIWRSADAAQPLSLVEGSSLQGLFLGLTYGGLTEEIMMRWGLMTALMAGLMRLLSRDNAAALAIAIAAVLFSLGHLPALAMAGVELTPALFSRIMLINAGLGLWFGWLYFKRDLESAILAHMGLHAGAFIMGIDFG